MCLFWLWQSCSWCRAIAWLPQSGLVANLLRHTCVICHRFLVGLPLACSMIPQTLFIVCTYCARHCRHTCQTCNLHVGLVAHVAEPIFVRDG